MRLSRSKQVLIMKDWHEQVFFSFHNKFLLIVIFKFKVPVCFLSYRVQISNASKCENYDRIRKKISELGKIIQENLF